MIRPIKLLSAAIAFSVSLAINAKEISSNRPATRLPATYENFFPSAPNQNIKNANEFQTSIALGNPIRPVFKSTLKAPALEGGNLYGSLYFFRDQNLQQGFYRINSTTGAGTHLWSDIYTDTYGMPMNHGWLRNGRLCGLSTMKFFGGIFIYAYVEFDFNTGEVLGFKQLPVMSDDMSNIFLTTAYRDFDDKVYGYGYTVDGEGFAFSCTDADDFDDIKIVRTVEQNQVCRSLCYNAQDDMFYGVNYANQFVSIDCKGVQTVLFDLDLENLRTFISGLAYDPASNLYYWNAYFEDGTALYSIDSLAETATKVADLAGGENYIFMLNTLDNVNAGAPAACSTPVLNFENGALAGTVTTTLPTVTYAGDAITDNLDYVLYDNGVAVEQGSAAAGSSITLNTTASAAGFHTFAVTTSNSAGRSLLASEKAWIGADTPVAPENLILTESKLTWDAVTGSVHGGYVDYSAVKYSVYLNDEKVGETSATSIDITLPQNKPFTSYTAYVTALFQDNESNSAASNFITYGEPLTINNNIHYRPEEKELELFTAVNVDGKKDSDGNDLTWRFTTDMGFPAFASGYDGDDWLFFPPIMFDDVTKAYRFEFEVGLVHDSDTSGRVSVYIGSEATPEAMTQVIIPSHQCLHMLGDIMVEYFSVNNPGVYYIGIHAITNKVSFHISDMDIARTTRAASLPMAVSNLSATPGADGALSAEVSFTLPTNLVSGAEIPADTEITATLKSRTTVPGTADEGTVTETLTVKGKPGQTLTATIKTAQNYNYIDVACEIDGAAGSTNSVLVYTGVVLPYIVNGLSAEVSEDNMSMKLTWTPPTEAENEDGPIGDTFFYSIWYYNNGWEFGDYVGWDVLEYTYTLPEGADLQYMTLGIMALNGAGQSDYISGITKVIGTPYKLPIKETFPAYMEAYEPIMIQRPSKEYEGTYWMVDDPGEIAAIFANTSKVAYIGFTQDLTNVKTRLSLPKFSTKGYTDITFTLDYYGGYSNGSYYAPITMLANAYQIEPVKLGDMPAGNKWISGTVTLPEQFEDKDWVEVLLDAFFEDDQHFAMFSGYSISGTSGATAPEASQGIITSTKGMIHVSGFAGLPLVISDMQGRVVCSTATLDIANGYAVAPGMYIVKAGKATKKVIVK